jgi:hypothetical protein
VDGEELFFGQGGGNDDDDFFDLDGSDDSGNDSDTTQQYDERVVTPRSIAAIAALLSLEAQVAVFAQYCAAQSLLQLRLSSQSASELARKCILWRTKHVREVQLPAQLASTPEWLSEAVARHGDVFLPNGVFVPRLPLEFSLAWLVAHDTPETIEDHILDSSNCSLFTQTDIFNDLYRHKPEVRTFHFQAPSHSSYLPFSLFSFLRLLLLLPFLPFPLAFFPACPPSSPPS